MAITLSNEDFDEIRKIIRTELMTVPAQGRPAQAAATGGATFPNYGRNKNEPVAGAEMQQLEYYRSGCLKTLGDASKQRWHDKERTLLAAIEAEMRRQGAPVPDDHEPRTVTGGGANGGGAGPDPSDVPFMWIECSADRI